METKKCTKCLEEKSIENFNKRRGKSDNICKTCKAKYMKKYLEEKGEEIKKKREGYGAKYYSLNKDKILEKRRLWREKFDVSPRRQAQRIYLASPAKYELFAHRLSFFEKVDQDKDGNLLVLCTYCGRSFSPKVTDCYHRIESAFNINRGECRFYCSPACKTACPTYRMYKSYKGKKIEKSSREVQPELRQMALLRDSYTCQSCGDCGECVQLHVHHIKAVVDDPIESADLDNVVTLCKDCHKKAHSKEGCGFHELRQLDCVNF